MQCDGTWQSMCRTLATAQASAGESGAVRIKEQQALCVCPDATPVAASTPHHHHHRLLPDTDPRALRETWQPWSPSCVVLRPGRGAHGLPVLPCLCDVIASGGSRDFTTAQRRAHGSRARRARPAPAITLPRAHRPPHRKRARGPINPKARVPLSRPTISPSRCETMWATLSGRRRHRRLLPLASLSATGQTSPAFPAWLDSDKGGAAPRPGRRP